MLIGLAEKNQVTYAKQRLARIPAEQEDAEGRRLLFGSGLIGSLGLGIGLTVVGRRQRKRAKGA